jgi:hypothetical protein
MSTLGKEKHTAVMPLWQLRRIRFIDSAHPDKVSKTSAPAVGARCSRRFGGGRPGNLLHVPVFLFPKGLRSFVAQGAESFLGLLPGPGEKDGLPESIRYWKHRVESTEKMSEGFCGKELTKIPDCPQSCFDCPQSCFSRYQVSARPMLRVQVTARAWRTVHD